MATQEVAQSVPDLIVSRRGMRERLWAYDVPNSGSRDGQDFLDAVADEITRLRAALEFYANGIGHSEIEDGGKIARAALAPIETGTDETA